tara:strand:+ start:635 stop:838 length:204 start_codon:yes stop_codon:yes gene_type:complete
LDDLYRQNKITRLAEEISFRLLATKKHENIDWLYKLLDENIPENKSYPDRYIDDSDMDNDGGDVFEY